MKNLHEIEEKINILLKKNTIGLGKMNKAFLLSVFILMLTINLISASDVSVWQGQYYTGTVFNIGTYEFNFTVYDALTGGDTCYSNTTTLTTGNWGDWETEQGEVGSACNNASKDYYLNINIDGVDQTPRRRLIVWDSLRKDVDEITTGKLETSSQVIAPTIQADTEIIAPTINASHIITTNVTTTETGFFSNLGSLVDRIINLWVIDINATGNIETSQNVSAEYFKGDGSLLTNLPSLTPVYLENNLTATNETYTTIFTIALTPNKMNVIRAYLAQSSSADGVAIRNRVIINATGPAGFCSLETLNGATTRSIQNIQVGTNSEDTGVTTLPAGLDILNIPFINFATCAILADADQTNLIIQFTSETEDTVTTHAGAYYTNAVN
ncbi:MAG: hypothetical protein PHT54_00170 [Candidatus Nanoarchaeia archaeon]|nr:hypothetical protein [Candidatus Nanoarchaeia archaeon]